MRDAVPTPPSAAQILLVCKNRHGLSARKAVLEEAGYCVVTATTPAEALHWLEQEHFDIVVTDHQPPSLNGLELIQGIRQKCPSQLIVLISGLVDTLGLNEQRTCADLVIQKSAREVDHLLRGVKQLLARSQAARKPPARHASALAQRQGRAGS